MVRYFCYIIFLVLIISKSYSDEIQNIEINADQFSHDKDEKRIYATGNVEVIDKEFKIYSEKLFYNSENKIISATDDVKVFFSDGTILKTNKIVVDDKFENGKFSESYLYIPDIQENIEKKRLMRIAAKSYEKKKGVWDIFKNAVFTVCDICYDKEENKYMDPFVQFKAKKVVHDKEKSEMRYYDSFVEFSGFPVFYLPYLSHPSPNIKRKSGFLAPSYEKNNFLGNAFTIPYYYNISDYHDLTVKPKFNTKRLPVAFIEHRKNFKNGKIESEISGTVSDSNINTLKTNRKRGHIKSSGEFDLNKNYTLNYNIHRVTDTNYLQAYKYKYEDTLKSNIELEGFFKNNYYSINTMTFQDLRKTINRKQTPTIAPRIISSLNSDFKINSFNHSSNFEILNLSRDEGTKMGKLSFSHDVTYPKILSDGTLFEFGAHLNGKLYKIENYSDPISGNFREKFYRNKFYPQITLGMSKPFYKLTKSSKQIFEPKLLFVAGANNGNDIQTPNEDSRNYDLDMSDLFNRNRLSGNDRVDNGSRIDYGINYTNQNQRFFSTTSMSIGQSYRLKKEVYQSSNSGTNNYFSDLVGNLNIKPTNKIELNSMFSLKSKNLALSYILTDAKLGTSKNNIFLNHLYSAPTNSGFDSTSIAKRNQIGSGFVNTISENWTFHGSTNFDLIDKIKFLNWKTKLIYENECFGLSFNWDRQYTYNSENPTSNNFNVMFSLKKVMENDL